MQEGELASQVLLSQLCTVRLCYFDRREFSDTLIQVYIQKQGLLKCDVCYQLLWLTLDSVPLRSVPQ